MRWLFQCFEGISLVLLEGGGHAAIVDMTGLTDLHLQAFRLLGPSYKKIYDVTK